MVLAALLRNTKNWKEPECPSTHEWINNLRYIHTVEYYSVMKKKELLSSGMPWMNLKCIYYIVLKSYILYDCIYMFFWERQNETEKISVVAKG